MSQKTTFKALFEKARKQLDYYVSWPIIQFTEAVVERMEVLQISNSELAKKLNCEPSYITKLLRGGTNFTLKSMVKIALVLDSELNVSLIPKATSEGWVDVLQSLEEGRKKQLNRHSNIWPLGRDATPQIVTIQAQRATEINEQFSLAA